MDVLDRGPDNGETTGLGGEHVDLIRPLPDSAKQTFDGIGRLNVSVHGRWELVKRQQVLFVLSQAPDRFRIALSVLGFEGGQLGQCFRLCRLLPDSREFSLDLAAHSSGDGIQNIALFMHETALTRRSRKQLPDRGQQSVMPIGHDQINVGGSSCAQVLQQAGPSILVLLQRRLAGLPPLCGLPDPPLTPSR